MAFFFAIISDILISLHFLRAQEPGMALICLMFITLIFMPYNEFKRIHQVWGIITAIIWGVTLYRYVDSRISNNLPYVRLILILGAVISFSITSSFLLQKKIKSNTVTYNSSIISFALTFIILFIAHHKSPFSVLLGHRIFGDFGLAQIFIHSFYSAFLVRLFLTTKNKNKIRLWIWTFFSIFFFSQFLLGISGIDLFLQTGKLHYPVPAMIVAGPLFRGSGHFMLLLLFSTILLVGPAWCSHLCYIGAFDNLMSKRKSKLNFNFNKFRYITLLLVIIIPLLLRKISSQYILHIVVCTFMTISILFFYFSRKSGQMIHCSYFCPIGLVTNIFGKLNPFRLVILDSCTKCMRCIDVCKYGALTKKVFLIIL